MNYSILTDQLISLIDPELPFISNLSNLLACLHNELPSLNWTGIYYYSNSNETLYLGPFQGKPACTIIPLGKGVVGTCAQKRKVSSYKTSILFQVILLVIQPAKANSLLLFLKMINYTLYWISIQTYILVLQNKIFSF